MDNLNLKKLFLYVLIASISLSAAIGIGVILFGNFGDLEARVLATTCTIACTSILGLACGAYLETKRGSTLPITGIIFSIISAVLFFILIWMERTFDSSFFLKSLASATMIAVTASHISLISIPILETKYLRSRKTIIACDTILLGILLFLLWLEVASESELIARVIAVLAIVITALTIVTPIFYKLSRVLPEAAEIDAEIDRLKTRIAELEAQKETISV